MDNQQKIQLLQAKFICNNNVNKLKTNTIIKEKFVGGGYKTFMETENKSKNNNKENFIQTLILNLNEPSNTPVPSRQKISLLFEKGRVDIDQDNRGISQIIEKESLNFINPQFSKIYNL